MSHHPLAAVDGVVVAELLRDDIVESLHHGIVAVVDAHGSRLLERGNADAIVFPRSTLKPLQAQTVLATGVDLTDLEIALTTASHCGSARHRESVAAFLDRHGLSAEALQCPIDWPLGLAERAEMAGAGPVGDRLAMNCSGKHAGFLAACVHKGWDLEGYLEPTHPLQQAIFATITDYAGEVPAFSSVDGCGAPLHGLSVAGLARGIARVAAQAEPQEKRFARAVTSHAWALDGTGRDNTLTIDTIGGIAKIGAEGLVVIGTPEGTAVAVKILDGSMRATSLVALAALAHVDAISQEVCDNLSKAMATPVTGGNRVIGGLRVRL